VLDVARAIDLDRAQTSSEALERTTFRHKGPPLLGAGVRRPLRFVRDAPPVELTERATDARVEVAIYDSGALAISRSIAFDARLEELVELSSELYDHAELIRRSREVARETMDALGAALVEPRLSEHVEDYVLFEAVPPPGDLRAAVAAERSALARLLRAERGALSDQEVDDALAKPVSYGSRDLCLVDWLAAFLVGDELEDERHVIELANVELLELRILDEQLRSGIDEAYELLARRRPRRALTVRSRELEHVARMQADDARLHEGIDNALELFGDDYLARLYRVAGARFHVDDWDRSIRRKLDVLRSVYASLADLASHRRSELLEWIIIVLIAADILLYFTPLR